MPSTFDEITFTDSSIINYTATKNGILQVQATANSACGIYGEDTTTGFAVISNMYAETGLCIINLPLLNEHTGMIQKQYGTCTIRKVRFYY